MAPKPKPAAASVRTRSGYDVGEVIEALWQAIESRDAETACCLAAEMVVSDMHERLIEVLVDVFAQWYAAVDYVALKRIHGNITTMSRGLPHGIEAKHAMCDMVIAMCLGLTRQNAIEHIHARVAKQGQKGDQETSIISRTMRVFPLMLKGRGHEALQAACDTLMYCTTRKNRVTSATTILVYQGLWEACKCAGLDKTPEKDWRKEFVNMASELFHREPSGTTTNTDVMLRCNARRNLVVCALVVSNSMATEEDPVPVPRHVWKTDANAAIAKASNKINDVFPQQRPQQQQHQQQQQQQQQQHQQQQQQPQHQQHQQQQQQQQHRIKQDRMSYLQCYTAPSQRHEHEQQQKKNKQPADAERKVIILGPSQSGAARKKQMEQEQTAAP